MSIDPFILAGLRSGVAFVAALSSAGLLIQFTSAPPIFGALVTTLVLAGVIFFLTAQTSFDSDCTTFDQLGAHVISSLAAMTGLWIIAALLPATSQFVCQPLVPWRFSIAIFGAFGTSWLSNGMKIQAPSIRTGLVIYVAFFWIASFYGFFYAPWFLAQTVVFPCEGRPLLQAIIVVLGMAVATAAGRRAATWMFG